MSKPQETRSRVAPWIIAAAACWLSVMQGCSSSDGVAPLDVHPVKGSVKLNDGKPLTSGVVVFVLPEKGLQFSAPVDAEGAFVLKSPYGDGAPEGSYKIRIERDPSKGDAQVKGGRKAAPLAPYPAKYGDETTSGLTAVVKPTDNALEPFVLAK
ncbi:hypothetical protein [Paludisphaera mucosa]|uniref:Carboxypeptidase regulatory-like domain-containing protein n=1 Tax=Paludisphaera mucosa TaxID=3030827 RepID=A0ABT6FH15_9BACT|nr:hypothetical protein [Paludisphaera mucosa]MDG3006878.1 hypothetical protein [Paludisphaera mucosa]